MMTLASGQDRQMAAVASTPFICGICTSMRMMSGRNCSASFTAALPSSASPANSKTALQFQNGFQSLTHERLVFGQQNPDGFHR